MDGACGSNRLSWVEPQRIPTASRLTVSEMAGPQSASQDDGLTVTLRLESGTPYRRSAGTLREDIRLGFRSVTVGRVLAGLARLSATLPGDSYRKDTAKLLKTRGLVV